jgi:hypothetical protein
MTTNFVVIFKDRRIQAEYNPLNRTILSYFSKFLTELADFFPKKLGKMEKYYPVQWMHSP